MSDTVSNIEIEDVLSSIRRLVSEETGSQPRPDAARQPAEENRLVLTPSLRVLDDAEQPMPKPDEAETGPQIDEGTPWRNPDATLYKAAQIEPEAGYDREDEGVEKVPLAEAEDLQDLANELAGRVEKPKRANPFDVFVMTNEAHRVESEPMPKAKVERAETDELIQDVAVSSRKTQFEKLHLLPETELEENITAAQDRAVPSIESEFEQPQVSAETDHHDDELSKKIGLDDLTPLSAKIAALETAIGETQDQWEPDGAAGDDYAGTPVQTLRWQDHEVEKPVSVETADEGRAAAQEIPQTSEQNFETVDEDTSDLDIFVGEDGIMDEESLRVLVADIVREELQGALGERITRNVRKLVRREIHRALTTQQLD